MKIIKDGRQENKPITITCYRCESVLEAVPSDVVRKRYDQSDGDSYQFNCAVCGNSIYVDMYATKWQGI